MLEEQVGYRRGIVKGQAEGVEETAKRLKALKRTREARRAQDYESVVPGLILDSRNPNSKSNTDYKTRQQSDVIAPQLVALRAAFLHTLQSISIIRTYLRTCTG